MLDSSRGFLFFGGLFLSLFLGKQLALLTGIDFLGVLVVGVAISCLGVFVRGPGFVRFDLNPFPQSDKPN